MTHSMTGFGKGEARGGGRGASVQLRSVNSRFLELNLKLPGALWAREAEVRALLQGGLERGKVDLFVAEESPAAEGPAPAVDAARARAWRDALKALSKDLGLPGEPGLEALLRLPGVLGTPAAPGAGEAADAGADEAARWALVREALAAALAGLREARAREGEALGRELEGLLRGAEAAVGRIEALSARLQESFSGRLRRRLAQLLEGFAPDDPRLAMEAALAADKADIREEVVRFRAHTAEFRRLLGAPGASGKRLDFLCQELLREANTMGSKSPDAELTQAVVALKSVVERLKEQAMNVE